MEPALVALISLALTVGALSIGLALSPRLPVAHLDARSQDAVKVGIGLVATLTALVLGLVTASAKSAFDQMDAAVKHTAVELITLDRLLARYGDETLPIRRQLKDVVEDRLTRLWRGSSPRRGLDAASARTVETLMADARGLGPATEEQRRLLGRAIGLAESLLEERWMLFSQSGASVPVPFVTIVLSWLAVIFASFGLFAPRNATVVTTLVVCALSVSAAMLLILELDGPFEGLIVVSDEPLRFVLAQIGA